MYETILSPVDYGGLRLKNRILFAPTTFGLSDEETLAKYRALAEGGCAMIIVGDVPVGKSRFEKSLFDAKGFAFYQQLAEIAHAADCKFCAQLHQSDSDLLAMLKYLPALLTKKLTPDQLREKLNDAVGPYITKLPKRKIQSILDGFGKAALLARQAGFDMVQVHGDRMCGSFSSALFNHRTDEYGGSAENRARFAVEAVRAVRTAVPGMPIDYKLAVRQEDPHFGNAGVAEEELSVFVPLLEQAGVTSFHVTLANHSALEDTIPPASHPYFGQPGCFLKFCDEVRQYTALPLCGVGGLNDPDFVEQQLVSGRIQCAAMSRPLLADPDLVNKPLCPLQQKVSGRADGPSGHPLHLRCAAGERSLSRPYHHHFREPTAPKEKLCAMPSYSAAKQATRNYWQTPSTTVCRRTPALISALLTPPLWTPTPSMWASGRTKAPPTPQFWNFWNSCTERRCFSSAQQALAAARAISTRS